jgi:hypothetical protein
LIDDDGISNHILFHSKKKTKVISLAFDGVDSMVYWTKATRGYEGVYRGKLDGSSKSELVASGEIIIIIEQQLIVPYTDYRSEEPKITWKVTGQESKM